MKRKLVFLSTLLLLSGMVMAQRGDSTMFEGLNLTEAQKTQMQTLKADHKNRMQAARETVMAETQTKMAEFLSAEQMQQYQAHKQEKMERMNKMKQKRHNRGDKKSKRSKDSSD